VASQDDDSPESVDGADDEDLGQPKTFSEIFGKRLLVGITFYEADGSILQQMQFCGEVIKSDEEGILLKLEGRRAGEEYRLPPDISAIEYAPPGDYELRSTGEFVVDPDFLARWNVTKPNRH